MILCFREPHFRKKKIEKQYFIPPEMLFSGIGFYYRSKGRRFNRKRLLSLPFMRRKKYYQIFYAISLGKDVFNAGRSLSLSFTTFKFTKKNSSLTVCHKLILSILPIEY